MSAAPQPPSQPLAGTVTASEAVVVTDLSVRTGSLGLIHDVSFTIDKGERVGLIGESGSGKSLTALALMGLLPDGLAASGHVGLHGVDGNLLDLRERRRSALRGNAMSMVFQEPMTALNPLMKVGRQVAEVMEVHDTATGRQAQARAIDLLGQVQLRDPEQVADRYPHQLSGGQRQRVMLAIALANGPDLFICDEPTTALDVTVQAQMLDLIVSGVEARNAGLLFITHDLAVVATVCERVLVMYGGHIVEAGPVHEVFTRPRHHYTAGLLAASDIDRAGPDGMLPTIVGTVPAAGAFPAGCVFRNRCEAADQQCHVPPPWVGTVDDGMACVHPVHHRHGEDGPTRPASPTSPAGGRP